MSSHENEIGQPVEQKSSIEISRSAKGDSQFKVKVYEGTTVDELTAMRTAAVDQYRALQAEFYGRAA